MIAMKYNLIYAERGIFGGKRIKSVIELTRLSRTAPYQEESPTLLQNNNFRFIITNAGEWPSPKRKEIKCIHKITWCLNIITFWIIRWKCSTHQCHWMFGFLRHIYFTTSITDKSGTKIYSALVPALYEIWNASPNLWY